MSDYQGMGPHTGNGSSGYGNEYNVGFSPGQIGPIPAWASKFMYQNQLYQQNHGWRDRQTMARIPLTVALMWTPLGLFLSWCIFTIADIGLSVILSDMPWYITIPGYALGWGIAIYWIAALTVGFWFNALILHRWRGGWLAPYLGWADRFLDDPDYRAKYGHYHSDPDVRAPFDYERLYRE